jgi:RNA polymerase sigma-70 factor, ECF subfamily
MYVGRMRTLRLVDSSPVPGRGSEPEEMRDEPLDLEEAFRRYASYVAAIGLRLLGRPDEVDDLVQDVFLDARRGIEQLRNGGALKAWLATITVRKARRRLRMRRFWRMLGREEEAHEIPAPGATPADQALLAAVYRALDTIPVAERLAWTLRHVEGERLDRVALMCGCSLATAKRRIAAAKQGIDRALDSAGARNADG